MPIAQRALVIGIDAANSRLTEFYMRQGKLPNLEKLMQRGVYAPNTYSPWPTITPPNWAAIATGASLGTHGITCFTLQHAGDPLGVFYSGFNSEECSAEYLWETAEAAGKRVAVIKWPTSWPSRLKKGVQVDGCHIHDCLHEVDTCHLFSTEPYPLSTPVELRPAVGWANAPESSRPLLETTVELRAIRHRELAGFVHHDQFYPETVALHVLVVASGSQGYDRAYVCRSKDAETALCNLSEGDLSDWLTATVPGLPDRPGPAKAYFRLNLAELSRDGRAFRLFASHLSPDRGYTFPDEFGPEITEAIGPFPIDTGYFGMIRSWISLETALEMLEETHRWYGEAVRYLWEHGNWDLCMLQCHTIDLVLHRCLRGMDPATAQDPEQMRYYQDFVGKAYAGFDAMVGRLVELVGDSTMVVVVSDHGATAGQMPVPPVNDILAEAGLLVYKESTGSGVRAIDWSRTKAAHQRVGYIYVNLKGRQPNGVVEPGEYEGVRERILDALLRYRDPRSGRWPFTMVLRREDAPVIGLAGDRIGDVIFAEREDCSHDHGGKLPTASTGISSMQPLLILAGPGIRQGVVLERPVHLLDVAPTVAFALGIPAPKDAEGGIIYQAFEEPGYYQTEIEKLGKERDRWRLAYTAHSNIIHQG